MKCDYCKETATTIIRKHGEVVEALCEDHTAEYAEPRGNVESMED